MGRKTKRKNSSASNGHNSETTALSPRSSRRPTKKTKVSASQPEKTGNATAKGLLALAEATRGLRRVSKSQPSASTSSQPAGKTSSAKVIMRNSSVESSFTVVKIFILDCGLKKLSSKATSKSSQKVSAWPKYSLASRYSLPNLDYLESFGLGLIDQDKGFTFHKHWSVDEVDQYLRSLFPEPMAWIDENGGWRALSKISNSNSLEVFPGVHPISGRELFQIANANGIFNPNTKNPPVLAFASKKAIPMTVIQTWMDRTPSSSKRKSSSQPSSKSQTNVSEPEASDQDSDSGSESTSSGSESNEEISSASGSEDVQAAFNPDDAVDDWDMEHTGNRSPGQMTEIVRSRSATPFGDLNASFDHSMLLHAVPQSEECFNFTDESCSDDELSDDCDPDTPALIPTEF
ncbi:hypothetical protein CVT24_003647 [Panaeolus cyanescens]|uniref:Uncharacterized protein n=1 Tax=Panaeolus cyanescens TaxID=181874 RepID=A0A409WMW1_9AGAR|nr:hypothetical protein CVT24_003647 [Panaeolus cyanescens]